VNALDFHGQDGIARSVALYRAVFPDLEIRVLAQHTDGDSVTSRWSLQGTHRDRRVTLPGITISRFENGNWTVSDNLELLRRLGPLRGLALAARYLTGRLPGAPCEPSARKMALERRGSLAAPRAMTSAREQIAVALQVQRPPLVCPHALAQPLPAVAVAIDVAVLKLDPRPLG
jgi:hypothetical protein